jgi:hypothetical protein
MAERETRWAMPCSVCGQPISLRSVGEGADLVAVESFGREHANCLAQLAEQDRLLETYAARRRRLVREAVQRAHTGPHAMLRTLSETEAAFLLDPVLDLLEDADELRAAAPRLIQLSDERRDARN